MGDGSFFPLCGSQGRNWGPQAGHQVLNDENDADA